VPSAVVDDHNGRQRICHRFLAARGPWWPLCRSVGGAARRPRNGGFGSSSLLARCPAFPDYSTSLVNRTFTWVDRVPGRWPWLGLAFHTVEGAGELW